MHFSEPTRAHRTRGWPYLIALAQLEMSALLPSYRVIPSRFSKIHCVHSIPSWHCSLLSSLSLILNDNFRISDLPASFHRPDPASQVRVGLEYSHTVSRCFGPIPPASLHPSPSRHFTLICFRHPFLIFPWFLRLPRVDQSSSVAPTNSSTRCKANNASLSLFIHRLFGRPSKRVHREQSDPRSEPSQFPESDTIRTL